MPYLRTERYQGNILLGRAQIEDYLGIRPQTLKRWINRYSLPAALVGGRWVSSKTAIDLWLVVQGKARRDRRNEGAHERAMIEAIGEGL